MYSPQWNRKIKNTDVPPDNPSLTAECYRRYAPKLFAYLRLHMPSSDDAEDMLYEVFLVILEHEQKLESMNEEELRAWLWTVARNKLIDYHRRHQHQQHIPLEYVAEMIGNESTPDEVALQHEEYAYLHAHLKQLSALQQEVLTLRFTAGLRCAEIATVLNKNEGAIRTMLSRALNTLRNSYQR